MIDILNKYNMGKKKLIGIGIFIILFLIALPLTLVQVQKQQNIRQHAQETGVYLTSASTEYSADNKDTIDIPITTANSLGKDISAVDTYITYDTNVLRLQNVKTQESAGFTEIIKDENIPGRIHYVAVNLSNINVSEPLEIATLTFNIVSKNNQTTGVNIENSTITLTGNSEAIKIGSIPEGKIKINLSNYTTAPSITPPVSIANTKLTPVPTSCVQNSGICIPSYPCTPGYTPSSLSCESSGVCCIVSSPTPTTFSSPSTLPSPTSIPKLPFTYSIFPKEGPQGTIFTVTVKTPTLDHGSKLRVNFHPSSASDFFTKIGVSNGLDGFYGFWRYVFTFDSSNYSPQNVEVSFFSSDGKQSIDYSDKDSFAILPEDKYTCIPIIKHGDPNEKIDIVIMTLNYKENQLKYFQEQTLPEQINYIFSKDPYNLNFNKFNVWFVKKATQFNCQAYDTKCLSLVEQIVTQACSFFDKIIVTDPKQYVNWADMNQFKMAFISKSIERYYLPMSLHEFSHIMGHLADEYYNHQAYSRTDLPNCDVFACPKWCSGTSKLKEPRCFNIEDENKCNKQKYNGEKCKWTVNRKCEYYDKDLNFGQACQEDTGCYYACGGIDGYRSSVTSVMSTTDPSKDPELNTISKRQIQKMIDSYVK